MSLLTRSLRRSKALSRMCDAVRRLRNRPAVIHTETVREVIKEVVRTAGIHQEADLQLATLKPHEKALLKTLVEHSRFFPGPIIEIGTLLGQTTTNIALWKLPEQKIITVDLYCWNPWGISPETHQAVTRQMLRYLTESGHVDQIHMDKDEFFRTYQGPAPALVFLDAIHSYEETKKDILWAQSVGAKIIAGHDYCEEFPGVIQVVQEFGGPVKLGGSVWYLPSPELAAHSTIIAPPLPRGSKFTYQNKELNSGTVSIIIPAYNAAKYIGEALADVAVQTYDNWEIIIVEDGSYEDCEEIVQIFKRRHPGRRIVYHRKPQNTGVSNTRNQAVALARGEFIAFLDADDRWLPSHLERKIKYLTNSGGDIAYSGVEMFDDKTKEALCIWGPNPDEVHSFVDSLFARAMLQPSGVVMRHSVIQDIGAFDEGLTIGEDYEFCLRAVQAGKTFIFDKTVTTRYRKNHAEAATTGRLVLCYENVARIASRYLRTIPGTSRRRRRAIARNYSRAGFGHLGLDSSPSNGVVPKKGVEMLIRAWRMQKHRLDYLGYAALGRIARSLGVLRWFRPMFAKRYH